MITCAARTQTSGAFHGESPPRDSHESPPAPRFTIDGSDELENHLARMCGQVLAGVQSIVPAAKLEAILLGGGYGRGEGGVLRVAVGDRPYNDLEFYVCVRGNRWLNERRYGRAMHTLAGELSSQAGVEVELKLFSLARLRESPASMFYYDLVMGHRWILGGEALLAGCEHHRDPGQIPLHEATRLLMNRCSGLLFAEERLRREPFTLGDADFVGRNLAKAQLAFGDVILTAQGQYHWSCLERHARLEHAGAFLDLPWLPQVVEDHAAAVNFKLRPWRTTATALTLAAQHRRVVALGLQVWLWLECRRLYYYFPSARDYALSQTESGLVADPWRNAAANLRAFGPRILFCKEAKRDPRARLLAAIAILVFEPALRTAGPLLQRLQNELQTSAADFNELVATYRSLWRKFN